AADAVGDPAPTIGAEDGADSGTHQHDRRLAEGEVPGLDQEREHESDQEVIEELQRIADDGGGQDLFLVGGQTRLSIENLEHWRFPMAHVRWRPRASRLRPAGAKTLRLQPTKRQAVGLLIETVG